MRKPIILFCSLLFAFCSSREALAACSKQNLTRCLDSACAINIGANPAARCQLCGDASAGDAPASGMKQLSLGASSKNTLSDKELKSAPPDPVERYAWAITACIKKVGGCTIEDSEEYDNLIEQSCRAAGIEMQAASAAKKANTKKDQSSCESEISLCVRGEKKCGAGFVSCKSDTDFDRVFSECVIASAGCGDFSAGIRAPLLSARDSSVKNAAALLATIVASHKAARESQVADARKSCEKNNSRDECVKKVCENNMRNKCAAGFAAEVSMATLLCKFHDTACGKLK